MLTVSSLNQIPTEVAATSVCIGKFDSIHLGHQEIFRQLVKIANAEDLTPAVVTFDKHPDFLLRPDAAKLPILGPSQKHELIAQSGIELMLELEFNEQLSNLSAQEFVEQILVQSLKARYVFIGSGFRFGNQGLGDLALLENLGAKFGFQVIEVDPVTIDGEVVSTTAIRNLLDLGEIKKTNSFLGRTHKVQGVIEHGLKIGRKIGFPTANMARDAEGYLPLDGVYAGWLASEGVRYPAAHSVGINETFQAVPRLVESHVLDETELDLYDKVVVLEFVDFVRPAAKFDGVDSLVTQINLDLDKVRKQLGLT